YNTKPSAAFSQLKKRLREDILSLLLSFNQNEEPKDFVDAEAMATKQVLYSKLLFTRGLDREAIFSLKKAFKLAEQHEAYEVQALAHAVLKTYSRGIEQEEVVDIERQFSGNIDILYDLVNLRLNRNIMPSEGNENSAVQVSPKPKITPCRKSKSLRLRFLSTTKAMENSFNKRQYQHSFKLASELLPCVESGDYAIAPSQKANFYGHLSKISLGLEHYEYAITYGQKASDLLTPFEERKMEVLINLFKSYFYQGAQNSFIHVLKECQSLSESVSKEFSELDLYQAFCSFLEGDHKGSIKHLNTFFKHTKLEIYRALAGKLLELMTLLEMSEYDWFEYKLDNFRKVVHYHTKMNMTHRYVIIYKALSSLKK
ncbi:MAG: hypothetical protein AAFY41_17290, partial [Bacteroidota bacterium]